MFIIHTGQLSVSVATPNNESTQLAVLGPGQFFGEMSLLTGEPRSATVITLQATSCIQIPKSAMMPVLAAWPNLAVSMARIVSERRLRGQPPPTEEVQKLSEDIDKHFSAGDFFNLFKSVSVFQSLVADERLVQLLISKCKLMKFKPNSYIVKQQVLNDIFHFWKMAKH